ncbi:hypothetical protein [Goodfellowiella coeruleoviolacea]|nr:hypothetical protein [Goodfellowiella coeruleoviolacea]
MADVDFEAAPEIVAARAEQRLPGTPGEIPGEEVEGRGAALCGPES